MELGGCQEALINYSVRRTRQARSGQRGQSPAGGQPGSCRFVSPGTDRRLSCGGGARRIETFLCPPETHGRLAEPASCVPCRTRNASDLGLHGARDLAEKAAPERNCGAVWPSPGTRVLSEADTVAPRGGRGSSEKCGFCLRRHSACTRWVAEGALSPVGPRCLLCGVRGGLAAAGP